MLTIFVARTTVNNDALLSLTPPNPEFCRAASRWMEMTGCTTWEHHNVVHIVLMTGIPSSRAHHDAVYTVHTVLPGNGMMA